jgi:hypothetical protein
VIGTAGLAQKFALMWPHLNERTRRMMAATEARQIGRGGVSIVSRACGLSRVTIAKGIRELDRPPLEPGRVRRAGGGRWRLEKADPDLPDALEHLLEPLARGDPESPLRWTSKSTRALAAELTAQKHPLSHEKVAGLLHDMGYSLQSNRKTEEGSDHPDRDAQFRHINEQVRNALARGWPVVSVDTKKKELIGNYVNAGRQWRRAKQPLVVNRYDFPKPSVPRAYPYGIYDLGRNTGFVNVGTDHDTGAFAVASIRGWWRAEGKRLYPKTRRLPITADGGGSNGTSKWNKVEHRLFSFISSNWRGEPLRDYETIVKLIAGTTTAQGLKVTCRLDRRRYATGKTVSDEESATLNLVPHEFHGEWNYSISPRRNSIKAIS